jgi:hypothetical protein
VSVGVGACVGASVATAGGDEVAVEVGAEVGMGVLVGTRVAVGGDVGLGASVGSDVAVGTSVGTEVAVGGVEVGGSVGGTGVGASVGGTGVGGTGVGGTAVGGAGVGCAGGGGSVGWGAGGGGSGGCGGPLGSCGCFSWPWLSWSATNSGAAVAVVGPTRAVPSSPTIARVRKRRETRVGSVDSVELSRDTQHRTMTDQPLRLGEGTLARPASAAKWQFFDPGSQDAPDAGEPPCVTIQLPITCVLERDVPRFREHALHQQRVPLVELIGQGVRGYRGISRFAFVRHWDGGRTVRVQRVVTSFGLGQSLNAQHALRSTGPAEEQYVWPINLRRTSTVRLHGRCSSREVGTAGRPT